MNVMPIASSERPHWLSTTPAPTRQSLTRTWNDPIVIVGAARTPMAAFQGDFASIDGAANSAPSRSRPRRARRHRARRRRRSRLRLRAARGPGPGAGAAGRARRGLAARDRCHDRQQDVRLGHEGRDDRARRARSPASSDVIVAGGMESMTQRAVPAAEGARRHTAWATARCSTTCSSTASRTPTTRAG